MNEKYVAQDIEKKWQKYWDENHTFKTEYDESKEKYYALEMFPYPSGNLHMGHVRNYSIGDVVARFKKMNGFNVLHPMGWDSFGMPAENAAIKHGIAPKTWTLDNIENMKKQQKALGLSYDWDREVATCKEDYYKWTQWFFEQFYKKGLAYKKEAKVNWCETCHTVLANEQVIDGLCWRCDNPVEKKDLSQWFLRITEYADRLLDDLDTLDGWPQRVKLMQKNWIGRSEGTEFSFDVPFINERISVYTTRVDTIYGVSYVVLAPEHPYVERLIENAPNKTDLDAFITRMRNMSDIDRTSTEAPKEGMFTGSYAVNPMSGEQVPIWIANYVLVDYGTGAVMGSPAHDERDWEFAHKYDLPIKPVVSHNGENYNFDTWEESDHEDGVLINSGEFDGQTSEEARKNITAALHERGIGEGKTNFRLRDWLISRQRYWGVPIPVVYCDTCGEQLVPEEELPVRLPEDVKFESGAVSPLATSEAFMNAKCPKCGGPARRETDTMDTFIDSSWYFLRYTDALNDKAPFDSKIANYWMNVDQYIGDLDWSDQGVEGSYRFLGRVWRIVDAYDQAAKENHTGDLTKDEVALRRELHRVIKKVTEDLDNNFNFNTAISAIMELVNAMYAHKDKAESVNADLANELTHNLVLLLAPFVPHITEELWHELGETESVHTMNWPTYEESALKVDEVEVVLQVNGKVRDKLTVSVNITKEELEALAKESSRVQEFTEGKQIVKVIYVPGKLVNIVVK